MAGETLPPDLPRYLRDLERRLTNVERAARLTNASVTGRLRVYDADGARVVTLGLLPSGEHGLLVEETETGVGHNMLEVSGGGVINPWLNSGWRAVADAVAVTSASFVETHRSGIELVKSEQLVFRVVVAVPVGTTAELRLSISGVPATSAKSITGTGVAAYHECRLEHGMALNGGPVFFSLEARRTAGAGTVEVDQPENMAHGGNMSPVAGGWV